MTELQQWADRVRAGDRRAVGRAMSAVESHEPQAEPLLKLLFAQAGAAQVVGVTGSPGAGKSTLVEKLAAEYRRRDERVGIVAVDPTSPFSGGAILGDRIRMQSLATDGGVYIRSMATRGELGGLAPAAHDIVTVLEAAGCGTVLVETVGVGQDEVEVAHLADVTVLVLAPGMGDDVQTFKAGVMEIADVFAVNKADRPGAGRVEQELSAMLSISPRADGWRPGIVKTVATTGEGTAELVKAIDDFRAFGERTNLKGIRRRAKWRARLLALLRQRLFEQVVHEHLGDACLDHWVDQVVEHRSDPYSVVEEIVGASTARPKMRTEGKTNSGSIENRQSKACAERSERIGNSTKVHHLGIAVKSLEEALPVFRRLTGSEPTPIEEVPEQRVRVAEFDVGESRLELLEPTAPDSPIARFLEKGGRGVHHVTLTVADLNQTLNDLERDGFKLIDRQPRTGAGGERIAFIHPSSTAGVLIELVEERHH
ncbi:MAG TPA: methylmalonyl Co-A mutase-associated GTPase MeaB [Terriglobia bacterium]|nr:methylmalonyl Co-A mutase-associated GTPase MeaB [Terriglobia bacterium]